MGKLVTYHHMRDLFVSSLNVIKNVPTKDISLSGRYRFILIHNNTILG